MKKLLILASLALIGVACYKSDDDNNNNNNNNNNAPDPWEEKMLLPTKYITQHSEDNRTEMVYTIEGGFIKEAREFEISGSERKEVKHFIIKPLKGKKLPATIDIEKDSILQEFIEFSYNDQGQVTEIRKQKMGSTSMSITYGYKDGKLSKFAPISSNSYELTYPDDHTVVATDVSGNFIYTYTFSPEGNLIKKVKDNISDGVVFLRDTYLYEYDLQKKNPKRNLQIQLITLANTPIEKYTFYDIYEATNSKNLVVKQVQQIQELKDSNNPSLGLNEGIFLETEYKNEANHPQGYATKITEVMGGYDGAIEKYEY